MSTEFTPLKTDFTSKGFRFQQVKREADVAIFHQTSTKNAAEAYEVIRVSRHNGYSFGDVTVPPGESYPRSEEWGSKGFTLPTRESAQAKFLELLATE